MILREKMITIDLKYGNTYGLHLQADLFYLNSRNKIVHGDYNYYISYDNSVMTISVDLSALPESIKSIYLIAAAGSRDNESMNFGYFYDLECIVEKVRYPISPCNEEAHTLIFARLDRKSEDTWEFTNQEIYSSYFLSTLRSSHTSSEREKVSSIKSEINESEEIKPVLIKQLENDYPILSLACDDEGRIISFCDETGKITTYNINTGKITIIKELEVSGISLGISSTGKYSAYGNKCGEYKIIDNENGKTIKSGVLESSIKKILFTKNEKYLLIGTKDGSIYAIDILGKIPDIKSESAGYSITDMLLTSEGKEVIYSLTDGSVRKIKFKDFSYTETYYTGCKTILSLSLCGKNLIAISESGCSVKIYDTEKRKTIGEIKSYGEIAAAAGNEENILIAGDIDGKIYIADRKLSAFTKVEKRHGDGISSIKICSGGKFLITSSYDSKIKLYKI